MKKIYYLFILLMLFMCTPTIHFYRKAIINPEKYKSIAIMPFKDYIKEPTSGELAVSLFAMKFMEKGFEVITPEEEDIEKVRDKVDLIMSGEVTVYKSQFVERRFLYIVSWVELVSTTGLSTRIVDAKTGKIIWIGSYTTESFSLQEGMNIIVNELFKSATDREYSYKVNIYE